MYTAARIQTGTGTIQIFLLNPTPNFRAACSQAHAICARLGKGKAYTYRIVELTQ